MGYSHVPAIVGQKFYDLPEKPPQEEIMHEILSNESLQVISQLKQFEYQNLKNFDVVWSETTPDHYTWLISHTGLWEEQPFTVKVDPSNPENRIADLNFNGEQFNSSGPIDTIMADLMNFLKRAF